METVLKLLEELEELIDQGKSGMFSTKVSIDRDEVFDVITEIRLRFPHELKQAKWVLEERNKILLEAQKESEDILKSAEEKIQKLVNEHEITKKAYQKAEEIVENSKAVAKEIRIGANEYADSILSDLDNRLRESMKQIHEQYLSNENFYSNILEIIHSNRIELSESVD